MIEERIRKRNRQKRRKRFLKIAAVGMVIFLLVTGVGFLTGRIGTITTIDLTEYSFGNRVIYKPGFYYEELSEGIQDRITGKSFPDVPPDGFYGITYDDLAYVRVKYYDFEGNVHKDGELIVHEDVAQDVVEIFHELFRSKYPIHSIRLVEDFGADDKASMEANNTSCFNYRMMEGYNSLSLHCFGLAIDINPLYNPYVLNGVVLPENGAAYVDRTKDFPGKIDKDDLAYRAFTERGWLWGGDYDASPDYQHFYKENVIDNELRYENK